MPPIRLPASRRSTPFDEQKIFRFARMNARWKTKRLLGLWQGAVSRRRRCYWPALAQAIPSCAALFRPG